MLPVGTRVSLKETSVWAEQAFHKGIRYTGTIVANKAGAHKDYRDTDPLSDIHEFDYIVSWDYQKSTTSGYFYPASDLFLEQIDNNEQGLKLLNEEE